MFNRTQPNQIPHRTQSFSRVSNRFLGGNMDHTDGQTRMGRPGQVIQYFSNLQDALLMLRIGVVVRRLVHVSGVSRRTYRVKRALAMDFQRVQRRFKDTRISGPQKRQFWVRC
jgi:hypothetical protein